MDEPVAIILAAGQSKRMKSELPKVIHQVDGRPMIDYVLDASRNAGARRIVVVVGHKADVVRQALSDQSDVEFALQAEQKGTGHAVMMCAEHLVGHNGPVLVLAGDTPLLRSESLASLLEEQQKHNAVCVVGTAETEANKGLGRIVRDNDGDFMGIVEEKDATPQQRGIREINTGCFAFDGRSLFRALAKVRPENQQAEYYLTDCPAILRSEGERVIASRLFDIREAMGVNTPEQLQEVEQILQQRVANL